MKSKYAIGYLPWRERFEKKFLFESHLKRKQVVAFIEQEIKTARLEAIKAIQKIIRKEAV